MPYKFELAGYCENCPYFLEDRISIDISSLEDPEYKMHHIIKCANRAACARAVRIVTGITGENNGSV